MSIKIKSKVTPNYDWKSILLEDTTGTGITGYGTNQDPALYRTVDGNVFYRLTLTSPSNVVYPIVVFDHTEFLDLLSNGFVIDYLFDNGVLNMNIDDTLEEGIWKIEYDVVFENEGLNTITVNADKINFTFTTSLSNKNVYLNNSYFVMDLETTEYGKIANLNFSNGTGSFTEAISEDGSITVSSSAYTSTTYTVIAKSIKECLDNKVADESLCECECTDCELVKKYLLFDAMYLNCLEGNITKAQQIFDYLTKFCNHCGC
jgi:hypothetical protein